MIGFIDLFFVSIASAFAMIWLISYAPIASKFLGINYSPRLFICRFLIPIDVFMTTVMVAGPWILGSGGVFHVVLATFTSLGLTAGTVIVRKFFIPIWKQKYEEAVRGNQQTVC